MHEAAKSNPKMAVYFIGVDVGTASVRAGIFDQTGRLIKSSAHELKIWSPKGPSGNYYEQSSDNIWESCCKVIKEVVENVNPEAVAGIGFDATCSLVALDSEDKPITVSPTGENQQNVIMWMDHRASQEADVINALNHSAFQYVGGKVSLEMQLPKLLWLKRNLSESWYQTKKFMDLPDFLTWKATNSESRSLCSVVCKWNYIIDEAGYHGWPGDLFELVGLKDLLDENASPIGSNIKFPGTPQGSGLSLAVAQELGLKPGTPVATSLIDAYAGALALFACHADVPLEQRLALICGTSTCHMLSVSQPTFIDGVWGPYADVLLPGMWLLEGGQSATGKLLDHIVETHPSYPSLKERLPPNTSIPEELSRILRVMSLPTGRPLSNLTKDIHVWPDFHGNRSPLADPNMKGMVCGMTFDVSEENLALLYLATIQALCYGTRHIIDCLGRSDLEIGSLMLCGGLTKIELFAVTMADAVGLPVVLPHKKETVLLGSAMLAASASTHFASLNEAMANMGGHGRTIHPNQQDKKFHDRKYQVFMKMLQDQKEYKSIMDN